jgi:hypothetical protein
MQEKSVTDEVNGEQPPGLLTGGALLLLHYFSFW